MPTDSFILCLAFFPCKEPLLSSLSLAKEQKTPLQAKVGEKQVNEKCFKLISFAGESWRRRISREDNLFGDHNQNDFFGGAFDEMEQRHKASDQLDEGFEIWEQKCLKVGGQKALDEWLLGQESLVYCVMENFEVATIQHEVEAKRQDGDLDEFFKKYCG